MPIRFRCAYCNQLMGIARRKAGQVVKCPKCGGEIIVPVPEGTEQPEATEQPADLGGAFEDADFNPAGAPAENAAATAAAEKPAEPIAPPPPAPKRFGVFLSIGMLFTCVVVIILLMILMFVLGLIIGGQKAAPPEPKASFTTKNHVAACPLFSGTVKNPQRNAWSCV
jgi:phage FluMu protein Com